MESNMEKWTGIISGTNRGLVLLEISYVEGNKIAGFLKLYDLNEINLTCKIEGNIEENNDISGKLYDFQPTGEGIPRSGSVKLTIAEDGKEMKGSWKTDIDTYGECLLYKFATPQTKDIELPEPKSTLETRDISISFSTFDRKNVLEIFTIMTSVANSIREGKEQTVLPPIYTIHYDKEERITTYNLEDFINKYDAAEKIWYLGFGFEKKDELTKININISRQEILSLDLRSNVLVQSTNKDNVTLIPEMVRGLVSKTRNKNSFFHQWFFDAAVQLLGVSGMLALSFLIRSRFIAWSSIENIGAYSFVASLIMLSNIWTYLSKGVFNFFYRSFPVVEVINKPKNRIWLTIVIGALGSILAGAIIYLIGLLLNLIF